MTNTTGLAEVFVHVVGIGHGADGGHARVEHHAQFARIEADLGVAGVTTDQLGVGTSRTGDLTTLGGLQLNIVDDRADRHRAEGRGVAGLHIDLVGGDDFVAGLEALRGQDVGELAVGLILDQGDEGGAVGVVLKTNDRGHALLATLEVDQAIQALGAAAAETDRDTAIAATTARLGQTFDQLLFRAALVELAAVDQHQAALARAGRVKVFQGHLIRAPS